MSRFIPNPEQFRVFCEFGFEQLNLNVRIFYSCCVQCGLESVRDDLDGETCFMFATVEDLEEAGKNGELLFHHGLRTEDGEISSDIEAAELMVDTLREQSMEVDWSGDAAQRFKVHVDRLSFKLLAESLADKMDMKTTRPAGAVEIPSGVEGYAVHIWYDDHEKHWWYEVSSSVEDYTYERDHKEYRNEVVKEALDLVQKLHLETN